ncbi:hypothetical protein [Agrobacterium tumefaciens]|uniref:hypothetical protein n=1 Tax=Agrobacterium tumefaciens TaxID=358 RepID=UPI0015734DF4|nr:hypothetical protein [Agrobacterium tumefaciens]
MEQDHNLEVIGYVSPTVIRVIWDGEVSHVPDTMDNSLRAWIFENWEMGPADPETGERDRVNTIPAYVAPPVAVPPITKRQLRLTLVRNGISLSVVEAAIEAMPEGLEKAEAQIEWADASEFERSHPTLLLIASALGLNAAQVDAMWLEAAVA